MAKAKATPPSSLTQSGRYASGACILSSFYPSLSRACITFEKCERREIMGVTSASRWIPDKFMGGEQMLNKSEFRSPAFLLCPCRVAPLHNSRSR